MKKELPIRKKTRLKTYDYNTQGAYFITICTKDREQLLSAVTYNNCLSTDETKSGIVGTDVLGGPLLTLTDYGIIADKYINQLGGFYDNISVEEYVIMPNHIHFLLILNGPPRTSVPTAENDIITPVQQTLISKFVSTFKRFTNKEYGKNIWQARSYDHVVRNKQDYNEIVKYIHENPKKWYYDELNIDKKDQL